MNQLQLPPSFEELIPENHLVRVVNTVVDSLELKPLYDRYKEGGCPAYHPGMMLKVMIYLFSQKTYSSFAESCRSRTGLGPPQGLLVVSFWLMVMR